VEEEAQEEEGGGGRRRKRRRRRRRRKRRRRRRRRKRWRRKRRRKEEEVLGRLPLCVQSPPPRHDAPLSSPSPYPSSFLPAPGSPQRQRTSQAPHGSRLHRVLTSSHHIPLPHPLYQH